MSAQTSTNNTALFQTGPQRKPEATRSWWTETPQGQMTRTAEAPDMRKRMARSVGAAMVPGGIIVGHIKAKG